MTDDAAPPAEGGGGQRRRRRRRRRRHGAREGGGTPAAGTETPATGDDASVDDGWEDDESETPETPPAPPPQPARAAQQHKQPQPQQPRREPQPAAPPRRPTPAPAAYSDALGGDDEAPTETPAIPWGTDDDAPAPTIVLAPDLPADPPRDDDDPLTYPLRDAPSPPFGDDVVGAVGVRFVPNGRITWCDAGEVEYGVGERVLVDSDRGQRLGWIATPTTRRTARDRGLRRVIRRASEGDMRGERDLDGERARLLRIAKDRAAALRLPAKVFRVELAGGGRRLNVYYTSDERIDLRDLIRDLGREVGQNVRIELRQLGVRDEAKAVGGIGSCGLTLCCTTWLPDFVPVSIKMAKDQGLVLSPTKVSGQCGRLKCCLVYEQAAYAELRKGLPKLGKRVIGARGEGRVVEVDVLRQRVRVSYGPGDTEVVPASEVRPMFPSGQQASAQNQRPRDEITDEATADLMTDDPRAIERLAPEPEPERTPLPEHDPEPEPEPSVSAELAEIPDTDLPDEES